MIISMIAALDRNRVIGVDNDLPWRLPNDMKRFRRLTTGKPVIMGRKTYESIGRPLPKRLNIVLTHNRDFEADGVLVVHSAESARQAAGDVDETFIIGGEAIYRLFLPHANRLYLTHVDTEVDGDIYFPEFDLTEWKEVERVQFSADERHAFAFTFVTYAKIQISDLNSCLETDQVHRRKYSQ